MIVKFPDLDILQLALTSAAIPPDVAQKPASAAFSEEGQVWVETSARLSSAVQKQLKRLGAVVTKTTGADLRLEAASWLELLPLVPEPLPTESLEQTPVLFDVPSGEELARLVIEILRLGNDRQSFRWLEDEERDGEEGGRALLRVVGPPYYSLLRALDQMGGPNLAPHAFIERTPGVWVEIGYHHPLAARIRPPKGELVLLRPPRQWTFVADAPFRDVYEITEFDMPQGGVRWTDSDLTTRLKVAPRLKLGGSPDGAELWVLRGSAIDELNRFVQNSEDQLLSRLSFAVGEKAGEKIVVLRVRQSKAPPPVVILPAEAYKHHLKLTNLFLPAGYILHPLLRRDIVRKLLAEDVNQITWLVLGESGTFTPESLPEDAFRPLTDWVDYVLDHDREMLQAWMGAMQFEFESFICSEDPPKPKKPPAPEKSPRSRRADGSSATLDDDSDRSAFALPEDQSAEDEDEQINPFSEGGEVEPSEVERELRRVEEQFLALEGGLDDEAHQALWPRLAELNTQLNRPEDAGICWSNALWEEKNASAKAAATWFRAEALGAAARYTASQRVKHSWVGKVVAGEGARRDPSGEDLDMLLRMEEPTTGDVRALAAYLVWSAHRSERPAPLLQRLQRVQRFLEKHEKLLPVRACWLAWYNLAQLLDGDVLALARARDRLLERLFQNGLRPEQDLPSFLRFAGQPAGQRFREVREWMRDLCEKAHDWVRANPSMVHKPLMDPYVDLIFSFGMARLGELDASKELLNGAREVLANKDVAHTFLLRAFEYRITEAMEGRTHTGPLPEKLMDDREGMDAMLRYVVDRVRYHSRILEPDQRLDPYRAWMARAGDLEKALSELPDLADRKEIIDRVQNLLKHTSKGTQGHEDRAKILRAALEVAPRVGEAFAKEMLDRALPAYDALPQPGDQNALEGQAKFLENALFTAGHFNSVEHLQQLVNRFQRMLQSQRGSQAVQAVEQLAGQCLRSLRKVGMREEINRLLSQMADLVLEGGSLEKLVGSISFAKDKPSSLVALLHIAASWYYFGQDHQADPVLSAVRAVLLKAESPPLNQTKLACAYARAVGQTTVEVAKKRLEEIFGQVRGVYDNFGSGTHVGVLQLDVLESVVLAVVSDDFTQGTQARRWLDDDEFLVRRRIHEDHRKMVEG
jgi:hypothetical protein